MLWASVSTLWIVAMISWASLSVAQRHPKLVGFLAGVITTCAAANTVVVIFAST